MFVDRRLGYSPIDPPPIMTCSAAASLLVWTILSGSCLGPNSLSETGKGVSVGYTVVVEKDLTVSRIGVIYRVLLGHEA